VLNRSSRTAEHVALFRALETARRRDRVIDDPYAVLFLTGRYRFFARLARVPAVRRWLERYLDRRFPGGPRASAVVRTRLIDELVADALAAGDGRDGLAADGGRDGLAGGRGQVVLLGAGYDSRAYRLAGLRSARVFEVDHPATQATKRRLVGTAVPAERRGHVRFVGVDLMRDDLAGALRRAGFSGEVRTVVVWEGVTNYLSAEAVDTTLRVLAGIAAGGSRIVFTYVDRAALDGSGKYQGVWQDAVRRQGEPWTFGFDPDALPGYLAERGLRLTLDLSARDAADRYLAPRGRHEPAAAFYRIAQAEVG
jgi:methyltransferase (TIGR00027 family)